MTLKSLKPTLFKLHRWIGIGLAPLFLLIVLSGAVLALKPIVQESAAAGTDTISADQVIGLLERIDPLGQDVVAISIDTAANLAEVRSRDPGIEGRYDLTSGAVMDDDGSISFDLFEFAEHLHKELLVGADILIQIASYLMLLMVLTAPLLAWPRLRNNLMGWHRSVGWLLLPIVLMLPLTGVLMSLHVGMPELPRMSQPGTSLSLVEALRSAQQEYGLDGLTNARRFRGGSVMLNTAGSDGERLLILTDDAVTPIDPKENLVKTLHEGTWGGPYSGTINLLGASALSLLILSGSISWLKRRRRMKCHAAVAVV
jgi:sulfite reductase (NADPH) flavoprotein alpha-component